MKLLKRAETLFRTGTAAGLSDGQLVERFVQRRDGAGEAAFAALVDRHGAMVLRICRQVLGDPHDAQDASQATFLVLARRAGSIGRRESVASWLHGVAVRVAAKARQAESRRRTREQRAVELMAMRYTVGGGTDECPERWVLLHDELGRLHASFREPLILCYLEGLTQEQAAAQLRCPLGTVQSRLAHGRAKLKSRLRKRGFEPAVVLSEAGRGTQHLAPTPEAWAEATIRLAMKFTRANAPAIVDGGVSAALAEETLKAMMLGKVKITAAMVLFAAVLVSAAVTWGGPNRNVTTQRAVLIAAALPAEKPEPQPAQKRAPAQPEWIMRTIRGTVRDEQGRPIPKAWIGHHPLDLGEDWEIVFPLDRIRDRKEPFRDEQGKIIPPGGLGRYFEMRDDAGKWQPADPAAVRRYDPSRPGAIDGPDDRAAVQTAISSGREVFEIRKAFNRFSMAPLHPKEGLSERTDAEGRFQVDCAMSTELPHDHVCFASADFTRQALRLVLADDPDRPLEITLKPVRFVRARLIETPVDHPQSLMYRCCTPPMLRSAISTSPTRLAKKVHS